MCDKKKKLLVLKVVKLSKWFRLSKKKKKEESEVYVFNKQGHEIFWKLHYADKKKLWFPKIIFISISVMIAATPIRKRYLMRYT